MFRGRNIIGPRNSRTPRGRNTIGLLSSKQMSEHQLHPKDRDLSTHASTVERYDTFFESALSQDAFCLLKALPGQIRRKGPTRLDASTACRSLTFQPVHLLWRV